MNGSSRPNEKEKSKAEQRINAVTKMWYMLQREFKSYSFLLSINAPELHQELCGDEQKLTSLKHSLILQ